MITPSRLLAPLALGLFVACTGSSSKSSGSGGGSGVNVSFQVSGSAVVEDTLTHGIVVDLSDTASEDIDLSFYWSGNALEFADYNVTSPPPVTIPAGSQSLTLTVQVFEDGFGELDEQLNLTLVKPVNAALAAPAQHTLTIFDEDQVTFPEVEPNEDHTSANDVGAIAKLLAWEITGSAVVTFFDVFKLTATEDTAVHLKLDPVSAVSEVVLNILDENGNVLVVVDDDQPGTTVETVFDALAGQVFFLAVTVEGAGTGYTLDAVGV